MASVAEQLDSYQDTVWALLAFHHEMTWDLEPNSYEAHHTERVSLAGGSEITPDVHLLVPDGLVVGDVKMSFAPEDDTKRQKDIEDQLRTYDVALTELGPSKKRAKAVCGVVLLVHQSRAGTAKRFAEGLSPPFTHNFAVVSYNRSDQAKVFVALEVRSGTLVPKHKHQKLSANAVHIDVDHINNSCGDILFYDAEPHDLLVMIALWGVLYQRAGLAQQSDDDPLPKTVRFGVRESAKTLADGFSIRRICPKATQSPSNTQMRRVFEKLVRMKLARRVDNETYEVLRKEFPDVRDAFEVRLENADRADAERAEKLKAREAMRDEKQKAREAEREEKLRARDAAKLARQTKKKGGEQFLLPGMPVARVTSKRAPEAKRTSDPLALTPAASDSDE